MAHNVARDIFLFVFAEIINSFLTPNFYLLTPNSNLLFCNQIKSICNVVVSLFVGKGVILSAKQSFFKQLNHEIEKTYSTNCISFCSY